MPRGRLWHYTNYGRVVHAGRGSALGAGGYERMADGVGGALFNATVLCLSQHWALSALGALLGVKGAVLTRTPSQGGGVCCQWHL
jgi:hypothetical protein